MKEIVIVGAGGFGREVVWLVEDINEQDPQWNIVGFVDDNISISDQLINGYPVVGDLNWLKQQSLNVVLAIGNPIAKREIMAQLSESKNAYPILIHPNVIRSKLADIGEGSIICASNIISVNATIGKHVIINLDCTIGHDAIIGNYSTILPSVNISGFVRTGECVNIGTGSAIIQNIEIGENTIIGAGSVVVKNLPPNCTAVCVPAKPIKLRG